MNCPAKPAWISVQKRGSGNHFAAALVFRGVKASIKPRRRPYNRKSENSTALNKKSCRRESINIQFDDFVRENVKFLKNS